MKRKTLFLGFLAWLSVCNGKVYHVSPDGNDLGSGTIHRPWASWKAGFSRLGAGDTLFIHGGVYTLEHAGERIEIRGIRGSEERPVHVLAYGENPVVLDLRNLREAGRYNYGIRLVNCSHWVLKGLSIRYVLQPNHGYAEGIALRSCTSMHLEQIQVHHCGGDGFVISESTGYIAVKNCDAFANASRDGENGNGFSLTFTPDTSALIHLTGCRAWDNLDDGFDCWENEAFVWFDSCWACANGTGGGDGVGFKLGKTNRDHGDRTIRRLRDCVAMSNTYTGFDQNGCQGGKHLTRCVAIANHYAGYTIDNNLHDVLTENISIRNGRNWLNPQATHRGNTWDVSGQEKDIRPSVLNLIRAACVSERGTDGSLPESGELWIRSLR